MRLRIILSLLLFFSGCISVEFVRKDLTPEKKAVLRYSPPSGEKEQAEYRDEVNKKAMEFCGGNFQVTKEYQARDVNDSSVGVGTGFGIGGNSSVFFGGSRPNTSMYNFVEVSCGAGPMPAPAPNKN
jgi:hypothetical protein